MKNVFDFFQRSKREERKLKTPGARERKNRLLPEARFRYSIFFVVV
jgi:hypothetical protein